MDIKAKLPVSYLLFTIRGRINRITYWTAFVFIWSAFYVLYNALDLLISHGATWALYPLLYGSLIATSIKRLHDRELSGYWLYLVLIPVLGPLVLCYLLFLRKGTVQPNRYGDVPGSAPDYFRNNEAERVPNAASGKRVVNDITRLNPVIVSRVEAPTSIEELQQVIRKADRPISIGGGRFSMGGQTASLDSIHVDMRKLNRVLEFSPERKTILVEAGIRWCDIQKTIDPHNLSIKIMQTYANFTVGGSLSVNVHGRYIGLGPVILSVKSIEVMLANGEIEYAAPHHNAELFYGCIGCYNALGVIIRAELGLDDNVLVKRHHRKMKAIEYKGFFSSNIRENKDVVFHNADIYPPEYRRVRSVSWIKTTDKPTVKTRLMPLSESYPVERYFIWSFSETPFGKWRREFMIEPLAYLFKKVHWRNYEAGYDVAELEPRSREKSTYVLQEYFVPVGRIDAFVSQMAEIFIRYNVNTLNVSIRHAHADPGSLLAWAREEVFAFVVYYKQGTDDCARNTVATWTRELIDAATSQGGCYYLPYQPHATAKQFHAAYPDAVKLFELKKRLDPDHRFSNTLWDKYYNQHN